MTWKRLGKALLFPPLALAIVLVPVSVAFLVCSMVFLGTKSAVSCISYSIAAYTLTVWCVKTPYLIRFFKKLKRENKYLSRWASDTHLRIRILLYGSLIWNVAYAVFQLVLGFLHRSFWFCSIACYYAALAVMRFSLARYASQHGRGERMRDELRKYRYCGIAFLILNLALALMVFFMVYWDRSFHHHEITTITMAAYTFTAFTVAVINLVRYRKYNSPVYSASKAISLAAACVSMLTLESTMLTTYGNGATGTVFRRVMLGATGAAASAFIIIMAVYMIAQSSKKLKALNQ